MVTASRPHATPPAPPAHRVPRARRRRRGALWTTALVLALAACGGSPGGTPSTPAPSTPAPSPSETTVTPSPTATAAGSDVEVWFTIDTRVGLRLARELRTVPGDPAVGAVEAMISGPEDPDYGTTWNPATQVLAVTEDAGTVTVDLSADARTANAGSEAAALMIQQLIWTVTGALGQEDAAVLMTVEGAPPGDLWGVVTWDTPVTRADPMSVRLPVQIDEPREGATITGTDLVVSGEAAAFEAVVPWTVLAADGTEVTSGTTMTSEGMTFAPYRVTVPLDPGTYTVVVTEDDPSGGAGGTPSSDSRTVTLTAP